MAAITEYEKNRALKTLRHWYMSHKQSAAYFEEQQNDKSVEYHKNQMQNCVWFANLINRLDTVPDVNLDSEEAPF